MVTLAGSSALETLTGSSGDDSLLGAISDTFIGGAGQDSLHALSGANLFFGNAGNDTLNGSTGSDTLFGGRDNDILYGYSGADSISGDLGDDIAAGNLGDDTVLGLDGADTVYGGQGNDQVFGNAGEDTVLGDLGDDTVRGGKDNDSVNGGAGDDKVYGDLGVDTLTGGAGNDTFVIVTETDEDIVTDFTQGEDIIDLSDTDITAFGEMTIEGGVLGTTISGTGVSFFVQFVSPDVFSAFDFIFSTGDDSVSFTLTSGSDSFAGEGAGDLFQTTSANFSSADTLDGDAGTDTIEGLDALTIIDADFTNVSNIEVLQVGDFAGQSIEIGSLARAAGLDSVIATSNTNDMTVDSSGWIPLASMNPNIATGSGDDSISSGTANDTINAGAGADTIAVGTGNDSITLGTDSDVDVIQFDETAASTINTSVITDFDVGEDDLDYNGTALANGTGLDGFVTATALATDTSNATIVAVDVAGQNATDNVEAQLVIANLAGSGFSADADDVVFFIINDGSGNSGLWVWNDTSADGGDGNGDVDLAEVRHHFDFTGVVASEFSAADFI